MEWKGAMIKNLKDHTHSSSAGLKPFKHVDEGCNTKKKMNTDKDTWDISEADILSGFAWPPRAYICTFCSREFRSAQALGGHMNVHRRDRARLRQSPSLHLINLNNHPTSPWNQSHHHDPIPNPNSNPTPSPSILSSSSSTSSFSTRLIPLCACPFPSSSHPSPSHPSHDATKEGATAVANATMPKLTPNMVTISSNINKSDRSGSVRIAKEEDYISGVTSSRNCTTMRVDFGCGGDLLGDSKEVLDLELKLGYS